MKKYLLFLLLFSACLKKPPPFSIPVEDAHTLGEKIWHNECKGTMEGLTYWNKGENFASLGIGHFIWYPENKKERFQETFPSFLQFLQKKGVILPNWLENTPSCPWDSKESFYGDIHSEKMKMLREFLFETRSLQALFMVDRLEQTLPSILACCSEIEKDQITHLFYRLAQDAKGLYVLIDYLNFKGSGVSPQESYKGQGWGLLQVLKRLPRHCKNPISDFVETAKDILKERVRNAPPERNEEQWLQGWLNRLDTYY